MASTVLTDLEFNNAHYSALFAAIYTDKLGVLNSVMEQIPDEIISPETTGLYAYLPTDYQLSDVSVPITSGLTTTVNNAEQYAGVAPWLEREVSWGADDIIGTVTGYDLGERIVGKIAEYAAKETQRLAILNISGVFGSALATSHTKDDSGVVFNAEGLIDAKALVQDSQDDMKFIAAHPYIYAAALKQKLAHQVGTVGGVMDGMPLNQILDMNLYTTSALEPTGGVYSTYIGAKGSVGYKFRNRKKSRYTNANIITIGDNIEVELARESTTAGGQDLFIVRFSLLTHVFGTAWDVTSGGSNPTDTAIALGSNYSKVANDDRLIKIVQYKSKAA